MNEKIEIDIEEKCIEGQKEINSFPLKVKSNTLEKPGVEDSRSVCKRHNVYHNKYKQFQQPPKRKRGDDSRHVSRAKDGKERMQSIETFSLVGSNDRNAIPW